MQKTCGQCGQGFVVAEEDLQFYEKVSPVFGGVKELIPPPSRCPSCREQRRMSFRNDRTYYSRTCELCKKPVISLYDPSRTQGVYCNVCWWSDHWESLQQGKVFDFGRPFFEQFKELLADVPKVTMINDDGVQSENCQYTSDFALGKNAYMVLCSWHVEDCMYGFQINWVKSSVDNLYLLRSELMYDSVVSENSYHCQHCQQVKDCSDCIFGYDLTNCSDCLLSAGLRNKKYCIWNQQLTAEEFFKRKEELNLGSWVAREKLKEEFAQFLLTIPRKYANLIQCENSSGDNLKRCKDSHECYNQSELHGCKFMTSGDKAVDCYDCTSTGNPELCYEALTPDNGYMNAFVADSWNDKYVLYSNHCHNSQHLFGCVGLKKNQYCILNQQYSKEEYEALVPRIVEHMRQTGEWGEFFPASVSLFKYEETAANEWYPLVTERAVSCGKETISWDQVPDHIGEAQDICREILACRKCTKNYRILKEELEFYKTQGIPVPRFCPDCRHAVRLAKLNPKKLWQRKCTSCGAGFETTYGPERPETVLCEECYLKVIY